MKKAIVIVFVCFFAFLASLPLLDNIRRALETPSKANNTATPRHLPTITPAERAELDARNAEYAQKIAADYYRQQIASDILRMSELASRFHDLNQVAAASTRLALPPIVQQMQAIRREAQSTTVHQCLTPAMSTLTESISEFTAAYLSFMTATSESQNMETARHINNGRAAISKYVVQRDSCVNW